MHRRAVLTLLAGAGAGLALGCRCAPRDPSLHAALDALRRGAAWLVAQQDASGAIPSRTYGFMALGQSTTALATRALLGLGPDLAPRSATEEALAWMLATRSPEGALGFASPASDYPVYATSLMLACLGMARPRRWESLAGPSAEWLRGQQLSERAGFDGPAVGGFPMGARTPPAPGVALHVDLSMTRRALEALRLLGAPPDDPALVAGRAFAAACVAPNGAFRYSPVEPIVNKGVRSEGEPADGLGYGSATTDGILALRAATADDTPAVEAALAWLRSNHRTDANPGVGDGSYAAYGAAMRFYYRAGAAQVFAALGGPDGWREALREALRSEQRDDGAWTNDSPLQKEDDPVIATSLALLALRATLPA